MIAVANAPCSWGLLEFESKNASPGYEQVLDEIAACGYAGTELGDWGYMPTDPAVLRERLDRRRLAMAGAFVTTRLADPRSYEASVRTAVETARLLASVGDGGRPVVVLSDEPTADPARTSAAGRVQPALSLTGRQWDDAARGVERIAAAVRDETGLRTVFHHHCAGYVETPDEIEALMQRTDPSLVGLCLDSGHATYGGGSPIELLSRHRARTWHVHFKDCEPQIAQRARQERLDYRDAIRRGVFCELGCGSVDFPALLRDLQEVDYDGWIVVEQDVLPALGLPAASATRNRQYLRGIGV